MKNAVQQHPLILLSGFSGSGKGTLIKALKLKVPSLYLAVSLTTRKKRAGEVEGKDYYFCSQESFFKHQKNNALLEYEQVHDAYYATLKSETTHRENPDERVIIEADVKGIQTIQNLELKTISIFLLPPSIDVLKHRLQGRQSESTEKQHLRLSRIKEECHYMTYYDYFVVNDSLETCTKEILKLFEKEGIISL